MDLAGRRILCLPLATATGRHLSNRKTCRLLPLLNTDRRLLTGGHPSLPNTIRFPVLLNTQNEAALRIANMLVMNPFTRRGRPRDLATRELIGERRLGTLFVLIASRWVARSLAALIAFACGERMRNWWNQF
jgi:hypothetical protein